MSLLFLTAGYAGWCLLLYLVQDAIFFPGAHSLPTTPPPPLGCEARWVQHPDGISTEVWVARAVGGGPEGPALIYLHGNGEGIQHQAHVIALARALNSTLVLPEYRGYGSSQGKPSQRAVSEDLNRIVDELASHGELDSRRLIYWGRSIGASFAAELAKRRPPAGLILQTPFARADRMALRYLGPPFLVRHPFRTDQALVDFKAPVLLIAHARDSIAPPRDAATLANIAPNAQLVTVDAEHNDSGSPTEATREEFAIRDFLTQR